MRILCIGDSNTFGYDPRSCFGSRYPAEIRWTDRLEDYDVINCGMNGLEIPKDSRPFTDLIRRKSPDLVIVMLGSNDLLEGADAETAGRRMELFLAALQEAEAKVFLIAPPVMQEGEWVQSAKLIEESGKLRARYRELAERTGIPFADASEWNVTLTFDGVHFSPEGHTAFAAGLAERLWKIQAEKTWNDSLPHSKNYAERSSD